MSIEERYYALSEIQRILPTASIPIVELAKPADVTPVIHAHWIDTLYGWACSNCEEEQEYTLYLGYCPHCGARMDGGRNDG